MHPKVKKIIWLIIIAGIILYLIQVLPQIFSGVFSKTVETSKSLGETKWFDFSKTFNPIKTPVPANRRVQ